MGVKYLWDIIDDARTTETLDCLRGKTIAIDLSIWIVEAIKTLQFKSGILKPHLRNIFFRVLFLRRLGAKLIFVTEGEAPDLKQEVMKKRAFAQYGVKMKTKGRMGRSRFQRTIDECTRMFDLIGIPHVRAQGEAEAMCAVLNKHGIVDGCLTNDGDFFLYGGETIYRDFGINPKDQHVLVYTTKTIKERTGLNRHDMIALALLNGCDYTEGVPGVGKRTIKKFLEDKNFSEDLLIRFQKWSDDDFLSEHDCSDAEMTILRKIFKGKLKFPNDQIIDEFLVQKDRLDNLRGKMKWSYPSIKELQAYLLKHLEWPEEYTLPKILQLATSTYLEKLSDDTFFPVPIEPKRIVKTKCQMGVSLVDLDWKKYSDNNTTYSSKWENCPESFVTLENQQAVSKVLPDLVAQYYEMKETKKKGTTKKKTTKQKEENDEKEAKNSSHSNDDDISLKKTEHEITSSLKEQTKDRGTTSNENYNINKDGTCSSDNESESEEDIVMLPSLTERLAKMKLVESHSCSLVMNMNNEKVSMNSKSIDKRSVVDSSIKDSKSTTPNEIIDDFQLKSNNERHTEPINENTVEITDNKQNPKDYFQVRSEDKFSFDDPVSNKENCLTVQQGFDKNTLSFLGKEINEVTDSRDNCVRANRKTFDKYEKGNAKNTNLNSTPLHQNEPRVPLAAYGKPHFLKEADTLLENITPVSSEQNEGKDFFSPSSDDFMIAAMDELDEKNCQKNVCLHSGMSKETPLCLDLCTPITSRKDKSSHLKDITNFSNLGDSILIEENDVIQNGGYVTTTPLQSNVSRHRDENDYEQALRRKLNLTTKDTALEEIDFVENDKSYVEDNLTEVEDKTDSPLCLADRLKIKMRSKK